MATLPLKDHPGFLRKVVFVLHDWNGIQTFMSRTIVTKLTVRTKD